MSLFDFFKQWKTQASTQKSQIPYPYEENLLPNPARDAAKAIRKAKRKEQDFSRLRNILLYSDSLDKKIGAVHSLAKAKHEGALNEVLETLKDPDGELTLHASIALSTFRKDALPILRCAVERWGTTGMHPLRNTPLNLRERLLYPLALLGSNGHFILNQVVQNDDNETVQTSSEDLLSVINNPIIFPDSIITVERTCVPLGWNLPSQVKSTSKTISLGTTSVHPKTLSIIAVLCAHQGLFGEGLRGKRPINDYYDLTKEDVEVRDV